MTPKNTFKATVLATVDEAHNASDIVKTMRLEIDPDGRILFLCDVAAEIDEKDLGVELILMRGAR